MDGPEGARIAWESHGSVPPFLPETSARERYVMSLGETGTTHAGDDGTRAGRSVSGHRDAPGVELPAVADQAGAMIFVRRLGSLDITHLEAVARVWRGAIAEDPRGWFASESAAARAVRAAGREQDQEAVIAALTDVVRRGGWWRLEYPDGATTPGFTEASVQYAATLAAMPSSSVTCCRRRTWN